jgi:hypothetical protein
MSPKRKAVDDGNQVAAKAPSRVQKYDSLSTHYPAGGGDKVDPLFTKFLCGEKWIPAAFADKSKGRGLASGSGGFSAGCVRLLRVGFFCTCCSALTFQSLFFCFAGM